MAEAAQLLVGVHDFRALAAGHPEDRSAVREVLRWEMNRDLENIVIECEANGFMKQQIRKANGILTEIGRGKCPVSAVADALAGEMIGAPLLPAHGLCLISVKYPGSIELGLENTGPK